MREPFFNLIDKPWIKVMTLKLNEEKVSIRDLFINCHNFRGLSGETPLQDNAILRLLIAISITCFYRYDKKGRESFLDDEDEAIERFKEIWDNKAFPERFINTYLNKWHDRFYLVGGEYPFYQVPEKFMRISQIKPDKKNHTGISVSVSPYGEKDDLSWVRPMSFNGEVLQSGNTPSPFTNKGEEEKNKMSYDEAARWLVYYMNYADCSLKKPSPKTTFTSKGVNIHPVGRNLFETIMLCSVLLDNNRLLYPQVSPAWERDSWTKINDAPYGETTPDNLPELYTQQSRKTLLHDADGYIDGMFAAAGDSYGSINAFIEPMFSFHVNEKIDKTGNTKLPIHISKGAKGWKEYEKIFVNEKSNPSRWVRELEENNIISDDTKIPYTMNDVAYGNMQCGVDHTVNTRIMLNAKFFVNDTEIEKARIEIENINKISSILKCFGQNIDLSYGIGRNKNGSIDSKIAARLVEEFEQVAGNLIEDYLTGKKNDSEIHKEEIKVARKAADSVLDNVNLLGYVGHGDNSIGNAENILRKALYAMEKKLCLLKGGEI